MANKTGKKDVYQIITDKFIAALEEGTIPWRKPFQSGNSPVNWLTQRPYRGINILLTEPGGEYATAKQIKQNNGWIKKGEKGSIVVFWLWSKIRYDEEGNILDKDADDEEAEYIKRFAKPKYYKVFEINTQVEGLESRRKDIVEYDHDPIDKAEELVESYIDRPDIKHSPSGAWYHPLFDEVNVPDKKEFESIFEYYATMYHELVHSTGHFKRLNRLKTNSRFGSYEYSKEELVAEIGSNFLASQVGFADNVFLNSASYINSWIKTLKNDPKMIVYASQQAQKAADYILGVECDQYVNA